MEFRLPRKWIILVHGLHHIYYHGYLNMRDHWTLWILGHIIVVLPNLTFDALALQVPGANFLTFDQWATERAFGLSFGRKYRQKFSRNVFLLFLAFLPIYRKSIFLQKERLCAETASFCSLFASNWEIFPISKDFWACRKRPFLQKDSLLDCKIES